MQDIPGSVGSHALYTSQYLLKETPYGTIERQKIMALTLTFSLPQLLLLVGLCTFLITFLYSTFLVYHWYAYGTNTATSTRTTILYLTGILCFGAGMAYALISYAHIY